MSGSVTGSNETINEAAGCSINVSGSNDVVNVAGSGYVGLISGDDDTIDMSSGSVDTVNNITGVVINGSNDVVGAGVGDTINVNGSDDVVDMANGGYVGLVSGTGDSVNMSNGGLDTVNYVYGITLNGSNDSIGAGVGDTINVDGSNDGISMAGGGYLGLVAGNGDSVFMTGGTLFTGYNVTNAFLNGSSDVVATGLSNSIDVAGNNDVINMGSLGFVGLTAGTGDVVNMNGGTLDTLNNVTTTTLNGWNDVVATGSGNSIDVTGSNDILNLGTSSYVEILAGTGDVVNMNSGTLDTVNNVTTATLNGWYDVVATGTGNSIDMTGSNDILNMGTSSSVEIIAGSGDVVNMNGGTVDTLNNVTTAVLNGANDVVATGSGNSIDVAGNNDVINMGSSGSVTLTSGTGDVVNMSAGALDTLNNVTTAFLNGSNDVVATGSGNSIDVAGSNDVITMGSFGFVGLTSGTRNVVNMSGGTLQTLNGISNITLNGSNDIVGTGSGNSIYVAGNSDNINMGSSGYVDLTSGNSDVVSMSGGTLAVLSNVTNVTVNGSSDAINIAASVSININGSGDTINDGYAGDSITVTGSGDVIYAAEGSSVTLTAHDSGDTIHMIGGTIVLGAGVTGITIDGTGDALSGAGAGTPGVIYYAGDIQDLVTYFEANPNLSQDDVQAAESDSNYDTNVSTYLNTANISAMPANVLAMLDGYSSLYLALMAVPASVLKEEDEIDQDFAWGSSQASVPSDGMLTMLQNLLPALLDTNATTERDVSDAIECLSSAEGSGTSQANIIVTDTAAKLLLEMAEQPDNAKTAPLTEPYRVSLPGLTGPYEIAVQPTLPFGDAGSNEMIYVKNEDGGFWGEFWNDLDSYVVPIVDAAAAVTGNFEIILAASALDAVEAGQDFASGQDLQGVFNVVAAVGGALQEIGAAGGAEQILGTYLSDGVTVAEGIDGIVNGAETGNALAILTSALGGASGIAGLGGQSTLQQFASVGASLGASAQELGTGNIVAGLASLVEGAQTSGALQPIMQGIDTLWMAFQAEIVGAFNSLTGSTIPAAAANQPSGSGNSWITIVTMTLADGTPGLSMFNPNDPTEPGNGSIINDMNNLPNTPGVFSVGAHGSPTYLYGYDGTDISPQELAETILLDPGYTPGETVKLYACNTGANPTTTALVEPMAVAAGPVPNFASQLAYYLGAPVIAPTQYLWFLPDNENPVVAPAVNSQGQAIQYTPGASEGPVLTGTAAWQTFYPTNNL